MRNQRDLSNPITLRIPKDILGDLESIARTSERSRSWVIVRALKAYLASEGGEILSVVKGRNEIDRGLGSGLDEVLDGLDDDREADAA